MTAPSDLQIVTLGIYGSTEESFFQTLEDANVDTFCDVRRHRGLRGARYKYGNSTRLQQRLDEMGIRYVHIKALAPTKDIRQRQKEVDEQRDVKKREREELGDVFVDAYREEILGAYELDQFFEALPDDAEVVALFCVEREPEACHRSLITDVLSDTYNVSVKHLHS
jgi:uncharacterized protein (DUF488 family)